MTMKAGKIMNPFNMNRKLLGGVEAGGTKMVCAVATEPGVILDEVRFPTTGSRETLARVVDYFESAQKQFAALGELGAIGYGTFGPAVVTVGEPGYGTILPTPKLGWQGADVLGVLAKSFPDVALSFDTDVNAAAVGEGYEGGSGVAGAAVGSKNYIYITVGTGIGGGVVIDGKPLNARPHAEIGHMRVPVLDGFPGCCDFHGDCLEGLASGTAMSQRWGMPAQDLAPDHEAWDLEASYLALMVQNLVACFAPEKIIMGGGVMEQEVLLPLIREKFQALAGGYWGSGGNNKGELLVSPAMGNQAGIIGALVMAEDFR